jgi:hypothetical protein
LVEEAGPTAMSSSGNDPLYAPSYPVPGFLEPATNCVFEKVFDYIAHWTCGRVKTEDVLMGTVKVVVHDATTLSSNVLHDLSNMAMLLAIGAVAIAVVMILKNMGSN